MSEVAVGILACIIMLVLFMTGLELAFGLALVGFVGFAYLVSFSAASNLLVKDFFDTFINYGFTVIPMFVLMGQVAAHTDIARRLYMATHKFVGHIPGGLAMTTVVGAAMFKSVCGSTLATAAAFAGIAIPEMDRYGYDKRLSTGVVASVGTLGVLIPPSIVLIIYAIIVEESVGKMFLAGIIPAAIICLLFMVVIYGWVKINPEVAPRAEPSPWSERLRALPEFIAVAIIFLVIIGGMMGGIFSPTEAGSIGTLAILIMAAMRRELTFKKIVIAVNEALRTSCMIITLVAGSMVLGHFLAVSEITFKAADWALGLPFSPSVIMMVIIVIYLIGGTFIDDLAFLILATPIFYPAVVKLGFDPLWFGIILIITIMVGIIIPPVAMAVFVVKNITGVPINIIYRGCLPFILSLVACVILLFIFPSLAYFLPNLLMK